MFNSNHSEDSDFWRKIVLGCITKLLSGGNYTAIQQSKHVDFVSDSIIPFLGRTPPSVNGKITPAVKSFMCDDYTPIELSMSWKPDTNRHLVRFSIEPLPPNEPIDPSSIVAYGLLAIDRLCQATQIPGSALADYFVPEPDLFMNILNTISNSQMRTTAISNIFLGFDLLPSRVQLKAYCVLNCSLDFTERLALTTRAIFAHTTETALSAFLTYFRGKSADWYSTYSPAPFIIGVDCTGTKDARIKIYFRYRSVTFDQLVDQLSLGGRILLSSEYISTLRDLWFRFTGDGRFLQSSDTNVTLYYEFSAIGSLPNVKCYLPVRLMARNDRVVADVTTDWLGDHAHFSKYRDPFLTTISETWYDQCCLI